METKNELITQENKWSFTLEEVEPANPEKCECAVYQYWLRRNGCVFLMTDNITAIPHIATEVKLQSLCDLLNINNFNEMDATCSGDKLRTAVSCWVAFDSMKIETRPTEYGKYLICRKDGKIHWETWNGSGWAYNHNEIRFWAVIVPPCSGPASDGTQKISVGTNQT